nr:nucleic acid-binding, OB-fold-like protein [Tanacetum cinerariifolium]
MRLGDQEVNVPKAFKKNVVPRKQRSITFADNIIPQEDVAVELVKSINIKEQRLLQRDIMTQLTIERQIEKDVEDTHAEWGQKLKGPTFEDPIVQSLLDLRKGFKESRLESLRQEKQAVGGEGSSDAHERYYKFEDICETDSDATRDSSCSDNDEDKDDETDDSDDSDMDLSDDEHKGDNDTAGTGVFMYNKSIVTLKSTYLSPTVTSSSLEYIQNLLNEHLVSELTDLMSNPMYTDAHTTLVVANPEGNPKVTSYISGAFEVPFEALDAQEAEPSFNKRTHDDQDPPNDHEGETRKKRRKDASQPSSISSKKDKAHVVPTQEAKLVDQPQYQEDVYVQEQKLKELIQKDKLTIADLKDGVKRSSLSDRSPEWNTSLGRWKTRILQDCICTLKIVDFSSPKVGIYVNIFQPHFEKLPKVKSAGDIIVLWGLMLKKDMSLINAVLFKDSGSFALYDGRDASSFSPYQTSSRLIGNNQEKKLFLTRLRQWSTTKTNTASSDSLSIKEIKEGGDFNLICKVLHICCSNEGQWMFFVWDGTDAPPLTVNSDLEAEFVSPLALQLESSPLKRDDLRKFPSVGTV